MKCTTKLTRIVLGIALVLAFAPSVAFASASSLQPGALDAGTTSPVEETGDDGASSQETLEAGSSVRLEHFASIRTQLQAALDEKAASVKGNKLLSYDHVLIEQIGTQEQTGHTICCPSFSCAYADAVMDGTVHDHDYYTCSQCTWTDWGGADSAYRSAGTDEQLLREAYDQISAGKPTVIHVSASYGEHWIALIGYENATDPDHLTLANFIALDPWDGAQVNAGESFTLYGDGCEHISER